MSEPLDPQPSAFARGFLGVPDPDLERSGEYLLGAVAGRALAATEADLLPEPDELEIRRRLKAIADSDAGADSTAPAAQQQARPSSGLRATGWLAAVAAVALCAVGLLLLRPQQQAVRCSDFDGLPVLDCSASTSTLRSSLAARADAAALLRRAVEQPPLVVVVGEATALLSAAQTPYLLVGLGEAAVQSGSQALVFETRSRAAYVDLRDRFLAVPKVAPVGEEMQRALREEALEWQSGSVVSVISVINLL